jgi:hypothetical protein
MSVCFEQSMAWIAIATTAKGVKTPKAAVSGGHARTTTLAIEHAVGAQNLTKAVAARNGRHGRFGSDSEGELKPRRVVPDG